jgi:hypothetical protein
LDYFNEMGRRIPTAKSRVFGAIGAPYYKINPLEIDCKAVLERFEKFNSVPRDLNLDVFVNRLEAVKEAVRADSNYSKLLAGTHVPFLVQAGIPGTDLGRGLEEDLLPRVGHSFREQFPDAHFKAVIQGNTKLASNVTLDPRSRYAEFVEAASEDGVVGWYFPQALQEFDIESQRQQTEELPTPVGMGVCLSGGIDICSSLIGSPGLLVNDNAYAPILCMSAYVHKDDRLALLIKAYGPHLEFWCMSQMLLPKIKQVSEQWSGGLTIYQRLKG